MKVAAAIVVEERKRPSRSRQQKCGNPKRMRKRKLIIYGA
jgi:hypothetical protein